MRDSRAGCAGGAAGTGSGALIPKLAGEVQIVSRRRSDGPAGAATGGEVLAGRSRNSANIDDSENVSA